MGFTPPRRVYVLDFEGTELEGLEVKTRGTTVGALFGTGDGLQAMADMPDPEALERLTELEQAKLAAPIAKQSLSMYEILADHLIGWNLTDQDGEDVPATLEGLRTLDQTHAAMIIKAWRQAVAAAPAPLSQPSSAGVPSVVASLPMETSSPSLAS